MTVVSVVFPHRFRTPGRRAKDAWEHWPSRATGVEGHSWNRMLIHLCLSFHARILEMHRSAKYLHPVWKGYYGDICGEPEITSPLWIWASEAELVLDLELPWYSGRRGYWTTSQRIPGRTWKNNDDRAVWKRVMCSAARSEKLKPDEKAQAGTVCCSTWWIPLQGWSVILPPRRGRVPQTPRGTSWSIAGAGRKGRWTTWARTPSETSRSCWIASWTPRLSSTNWPVNLSLHYLWSGDCSQAND